ncbi:MAG: hypothetical protein AAGA99_27030, partial [Actinomycetota bacterium]
LLAIALIKSNSSVRERNAVEKVNKPIRVLVAVASGALATARARHRLGRCGLGAEHVADQRAQLLPTRRAFEARPDRHGDPAPRPHHATQLSERGSPILEEHQTELADRGIDRIVVERQPLGCALAPVDARSPVASHTEHAAVEVDADDVARGADTLGRNPGRDTGPAGDIDDALALVEQRGVAHHRCPLREERRDEERLVDLRAVERELASFCIGHR